LSHKSRRLMENIGPDIILPGQIAISTNFFSRGIPLLLGVETDIILLH